MTENTRIEIAAVITRLRKNGDEEAAYVIERLQGAFNLIVSDQNETAKYALWGTIGILTIIASVIILRILLDIIYLEQ